MNKKTDEVILEEEIFAVSSKNLKRKAKDSVFTSLFKDPENVARLYMDLHPECKNVKASDVDIKTLTSVFVDSIYNDLGFVVKENGKDKVIVLVEAQSTWNPNMPLRMWFYLSETYRDYVKKTRQNLYGSKKIQLPPPEMYLIFTGKRKNKVKIMSLGDDFFGGEILKNMKIHVLYESDNTIYGEYIGFCKILDKNKNLYNGDTKKIFLKTFEECVEKSYLTEFLKNHKEEIYTMIDDLFDEETWKEIWLEDHDKEIMAKGEKKGREEGKIDMLISLVRKGILDITQAASEANMSLEDFKKMVES